MITVYGEALVDLVPTTADPLAPLQPALGGGPFNVARALGRLGADVEFQSRLSVTVLKLSDEEVDFLSDTSHVPVVVTTLGAEGISVRAPFGTCTVPAPKVQVADTIGAGDTIMAALVYQFQHRGLDRQGLLDLDAQQWEDILCFAAHAAALTVSRTGAETPRLEEVYAFQRGE